MNKQIREVKELKELKEICVVRAVGKVGLIGLILFALQGVSLGADNYLENMQQLSEQTDMQSAHNQLLEAQVKAQTLQQKLKHLNTDKTPVAQTSVALPQVTKSVHEVKDQTLLPQYDYGLKQVYGMGDNLTAVIEYGANVIPVKKGDSLDGVWKVIAVHETQIILYNTVKKKKKYLYLTQK
ncbi:type IV pilus biogenesis protein PilP [Cysteiniphilum litorale]|uniref:type IV pilus biogenesis protein PilP n=1 Tax=Cysteiniphilum litorale TaxID=2056700 RepID=UPI003F881F3A